MAPQVRQRFALLDPDVLRDPYPTYAQMRETAPVWWDEGMQAWLVTRYADAVKCFLDDRLSADINHLYFGLLDDDVHEELLPLQRFYEQWMVFSDPPYQSRLRKVLHRAFTPAAVAVYRGELEALAARLLDPIRQRGEADLVRDFAVPYSTGALRLLFGVRERDFERLAHWSDHLIGFISTGRPIPERGRDTYAQLVEMRRFLRLLVEEHAAGGDGSSVFDVMVEAMADGSMSEDEFVATFAQLMTGGISPVTHALGTGTLALLRAPDQLDRLRSDPSLMRPAVEEVHRYDPAFQLGPRMAKADVELGGEEISAGQRVLLVLGAANRDPARFADPDRLDVGRADNRHLSFGLGHHYCLGAALSRLEVQVALSALLERLPRLRLAGDAPRAPYFGVAALERLPVATG